MGMLKEFKEFAVKGNVIDLAIGVIIGAAFSKIVNSMVDDVITPLILKPALDMAGQKDLDKLTVFHTVKVGVFLSAILNFLIVAFLLFLLVKGVNRFKKKEEAAAAPTPEEIILLREIRDSLKK